MYAPDTVSIDGALVSYQLPFILFRVSGRHSQHALDVTDFVGCGICVPRHVSYHRVAQLLNTILLYVIYIKFILNCINVV